MIELNRYDHGAKIAEAAGCLLDIEHDVVISRTDDYGKLLGGVIFREYTGASITIHLAGFSPHWVSRDLIWVVMHYPFVQLSCVSLFAQVRSLNKRAIGFIENFGFKYEVTIPEVYSDGEDLIVYRLRKENCRWLKLKPKNITFRGNYKEAA